jgi:GT2 family glycosyltransferase
MNRDRIGIVVVTYNAEAHIGACLDAALRTGSDVVVVDNASSDGTIREGAHRGVRLIANHTNRGFAAAANQGISSLTTEYVLLLNPDAIIQTPLDPLRDACDLPNVAGSGGRLIGDDGAPQIGFMARRLPTPAALIFEVLLLNRVWPHNPVNRRYRALDLDPTHSAEIEQPAGAFFLFRRAAWQEIGGFDESFHPLWFEDVDFCRRLLDRNYRLFYVPQAVAKHTGGYSTGRLPLEMRRFYWYRSLLTYSVKHFGRLSCRAVCLAVIIGSFPRFLSDVAAERSFKPAVAWGKVVRFAGGCLFCGRVGDAVSGS